MKKVTICFLIFLFSSIPFFSNAQSSNNAPLKKKYASTDWVNMMRDQTVNIHDVQKAFNKWYKIHNKEDKDKIKAKSAQAGEEDDGAYAFFKRWEWFNLPRADRNGNRPDLFKIGSQYQAYLNSKRSQQQTHSRLHNVSSVNNWTYEGNTAVPTKSRSGNGGDGRVNRVRLMPGNTNTMFACAPSGGLWKTTNGGTSWSTNTDQLGDLSTSDIAINPLKTSVMYLGTGDADGIQTIYPTPATIGVLKSYDGGITWDTTGLAYSMSVAGASSFAVSELLIDPSDTSVLIAATTFGVWRSSNSGYSWKREQPGWFHSIEFQPGNPSIVYAGSSSLMNGGATFYRSTDNGITWTKITSGLPSGTAAEGFEIGVSAADTNAVYVFADSAGTYGFEGLYRSTDHGVTFSTMSLFADAGVPNVLGWQQNGGDIDGQGWYTLSMAVSQTNADSIWVGGVNIWASSDGGVTWNVSSDWAGNPYLHADIHSIQFIPGTNSKGYVVGCDGGVFKTTNGGSSWTDLSNNLEIAQQYCIGPEAATAGKWITGWQDNGTNFSSAPWGQVMGGDGMDCFIDWSNNNNMFAETGQGGLSKSTNAGVNWAGCVAGITENGPWVTPWVQDPKTSTTIYSGFNNVWKSTNSAGNWTKISTWGNGGDITAIAVDSANPAYIYAAQAGIIELTTNGGTSWSNITGSLPLGNTSISGVAVSSKKPSHVWVSLAGYSGNEVYASTNSGTTWTNISTGLPSLPVNCIVSESGSPNAIYVGTDQGVYYHDTITNNWVFYNTGLPLVMIADLKIYKPGKQLLAATYGRGTWESPLFSPLPPVANFHGVSTTVCAGSSVLFTDTSSNNPTSWQWTFAGGTPSTSTSPTQSVIYTTPGIYPVKLVVSNFYGSDSITKISYVTVTTSPSATVSVSTNILCHGDKTGSVSCSPLGGSPPYTYLWSGGGTNATKTGLLAGTYSITVTDNIGCTATATATIIQPTAMVVLKDSVNVNSSGACNGEASVNISGGTAPYTYIWNPGGGTNDTINGKCSGTYCCSITDNNGCTRTTCITIKNVTGIENINLSSGNISIYPDPNNGSFTVAGVIQGQIIELYNAIGQKLSSVIVNNTTMSFNISSKADGLYLVRVLDTEGNLVSQKKLMKTK